MNATHRILVALAKAGEHGLTGRDIRQHTGAGGNYLRLVRLVTAGLVTRTWQPAHPGTRRRRLYRVTDLGRAEGRQLDLLPPPPARRALPRPCFLDGRGRAALASGDGGSSSDALSTRWPHPVLLRNHLLGGTLHRPIDRLEAQRLRELDPDIDTQARAVEIQRGHALRTLTDRGLVEQVLDLSTGLPAHRVVRCAHVALEDDTSPVPVVYVVTDHHVAAATRAAVNHHSHVGVVVANPCDVHAVWQAVTGFNTTRPGRLLHPGRPVVLDALTISDLVPDPRRLCAVLRAWRTTVREDSLLVLARSPDPALPDPVPIARRAGWQQLPGFTPPAPQNATVADRRTQVTVLTTGLHRWWGQPARRRPATGTPW
ncbi:SAM-dependent methyltransferase [Saccharothrix sp. Mg75]|uniref:SAM-dependent methyltransferase n=1 Tax=Saccharothrix sp. Mg75 TaxID=3445357 RepID=UPI003EECA603